MISSEEAEAHILLKFLGGGRGFVGGQHTHIRNVAKGKPPEDRSVIEKVFKELCRRGWFIQKPTKDGIHASLNPKVRVQVCERLRELGHTF